MRKSNAKQEKKPYVDEQRARDYRAVFDTPVGRKVLNDIMSKAYVTTPILATGEMAQRAEGARHLAIHIASFVIFDASDYVDYVRKSRDED